MSKINLMIYTISVTNIKNLILNILFLLSGVGLFLFCKNMFYLHIIVISLMILILIKCYYQGIKDGLLWLSLIILPMTFSMIKNNIPTLNVISEILLILGSGTIVGLLAEKQKQYIKQLKETYVSTLNALAAIIDARDHYTQGHSERVAKYSVSIAKEMLLSNSAINYLEQASLLHDIGKVAVPDRILNKRSPLGEDEQLIIKKHPEYGQRILSNLSFLSQIIPIVLYHHKRFCDNDYGPEKLPTALLLATRILTVADAFDAMTTDRPYRDRLNPEQALGELEKYSGTQFDPQVVKALKKVIKLKLWEK